MNKVCLLLFVVSVVLAQVEDDLSIWPQPVEYINGDTPLQVSTAFQFVCESTCSSVLNVAFIRYMSYIFFANVSQELNFQQSALTTLTIVVAQQDVPLEIGVDESYQLSVTSDGAVLKANTDWGALRGLDTFSQLVNIDIPSGNYFIQHTPITIYDSPRFKWRGLLIDSARHFLDLPSIMRQLNAMEAGKMNVLHWHLSDDQSFSLESTSFPLLSEKGAWSPNSVYTTEDIQFIIQYAELRGITIVPEFDMPAHANAMYKGYPELGTPCAPQFYKLIDASNNNTYDFVEQFLTEISGLFQSNYIHLGSDEVGYKCWENSTEIQEFMIQHKLANESEVHNYFEQKVQGIASSLGKQTILWEEAFDSKFKLLSDTIIEVWLDLEEVEAVVKSGHNTIVAKGYYLDQQEPGPEYNYFWEDTWKDFYQNDPVGNITYTADELELILGGEACMWGEQVDSNVIDCRIWPRALAVAERLWSPQSVVDVDDAQGRLIVHRCRLVRRGIGASPLRPDFCYTGKNYKHKQDLKLF